MCMSSVTVFITSPPVGALGEEKPQNNQQTSCCSTDSERPHHCCRLPNNCDSRRIFPIFHNRPVLSDAVGWATGRAPACKKLSGGGAGVAICMERGADLHMAPLMPLPLTVSCFSKI